MTDNEKKLLQAQHRLEEAQARNRVKERKARTRRLIQEGAVLEKVLPQTVGMDLNELETYLYRRANGVHKAGASRFAGALCFFRPERRTYSPPASGRWYGLRPPCALRGGLRFLRKAPADASRHRRRNRRSHSRVIACCLRKPATGSFSQFTGDGGQGTGDEGRR